MRNWSSEMLISYYYNGYGQQSQFISIYFIILLLINNFPSEVFHFR